MNGHQGQDEHGGEQGAGTPGAPHADPPPPADMPPAPPYEPPPLAAGLHLPPIVPPVQSAMPPASYAALEQALTQSGPRAAVEGEISYNGSRWIPAGLYPRIGAFLLDFVILFSAFWLLGKAVEMPPLDPSLVFAAQMTLVMEMISGEVIDPAAARIAEDAMRRERFRGWMNVLMCCAYFTLFQGLSGASPGKLALGLRVLRKDGRLPGLGWAFARYLGYFAVAKLYYSAWLIPFDKQKRTLYDLLLGMNVYKRVR